MVNTHILPGGVARFGAGLRGSRGGSSRLQERRPGLATLPPPTACPFGVQPAPADILPWSGGGGGLRMWGRVTSTTARALVGRRSALWGRQEGAPELALRASVGGVRGWAPSLPPPPVVWACSWGPLPCFLGHGGCRCGGPSPTPQHALLRAAVCALWGLQVGLGWGRAPRVSVSGVRGLALSVPRLSAVWACSRGLLFFFLGRSGCGCGGPSPTPQRTLLRPHVALLGCWEDALGRAPRASCVVPLGWWDA